MSEEDKNRIRWHESNLQMEKDKLTAYKLPILRDPLLELEFNGEKKYRILYSEIKAVVDEMQEELKAMRHKEWWEIWK